MFVAGGQLLKGAALNAVQIAEQLRAAGSRDRVLRQKQVYAAR